MGMPEVRAHDHTMIIIGYHTRFHLVLFRTKSKTIRHNMEYYTTFWLSVSNQRLGCQEYDPAWQAVKLSIWNWYCSVYPQFAAAPICIHLKYSTVYFTSTIRPMYTKTHGHVIPMHVFATHACVSSIVGNWEFILRWMWNDNCAKFALSPFSGDSTHARKMLYVRPYCVFT